MDTAVKTYAFSRDGAALVLGPYDRNLPYLESLMCTDLSVRGTSLTADPAPLYFSEFMQRLEKSAGERGPLSEAEIYMEFQLLMQPEVGSADGGPSELAVLDKLIRPRSQAQKALIRALSFTASRDKPSDHRDLLKHQDHCQAYPVDHKRHDHGKIHRMCHKNRKPLAYRDKKHMDHIDPQPRRCGLRHSLLRDQTVKTLPLHMLSK